MQINSLETGEGLSAYYSRELMTMYRSFLPYISNNYNELTIKPHMAYKYQGDFYGLLEELNVDKVHHLYVLMFNGLMNSCDYDGVSNVIKIPNMELLDNLRMMVSSS